MDVKIFSTQHHGHVIGEVINVEYYEDLKSRNCVHLRNPGAIQVVQTEKGIQFVVGEIIPPFYANQSDLLNDFPVKLKDVMFEGKADPGMTERYKKYATKLIEKRSGIQVVGSGALDKLKELGGKLIK